MKGRENSISAFMGEVEGELTQFRKLLGKWRDPEEFRNGLTKHLLCGWTNSRSDTEVGSVWGE